MGYTLQAIRQALSAAGVSVSRSTVHREATRRAEPASLPVTIQPAHRNATAMPAPSPAAFSPVAPARKASRSPTSGRLSGKDNAEAFFSAHPSNPLFPTKEIS